MKNLKNLMIIAAVGLMTCGTVLAQPEPGFGRRGPRGDGPPRGGDRFGGANRMIERIVEELNLDDDQRAVFEEATAAQRQQMSDMSQRWDEVRQAREDGDDERAEQLTQELRSEMQAGWRDRGAGMEEALKQLEPVLNDDQLAKLWDMQERMDQRRQAGEQYRSVVRDLPDALDLDEEQRIDFEDMLAAGREQMRDRWQEMRPLMEQRDEAREAGDEERVAELERQIEAARPDADTSFEEFYKNLSEILTDEQKVALAEFRQKQQGGSATEGKKGGPADVRDVLRAVKRLRLNEAQKADVREIERGAIGSYRKLKRDDRESHTALAKDVQADIVAVLDKDQKAQFEQELQRVSRRSRG